MHTYEEGQLLHLRATGSTTPIEARVSKLLEPWTLSVVMVIDILATPDTLDIPSRSFLKLYDRRYSKQSRSDWHTVDWTPEVECQLIDFSRTGEAQRFLKKWREDPDFDDDDDSWGIAENETGLSENMQELSQTETKVYHSLRHHQGRLVPQLYAEVILQTGPQDDLGGSPELFDIPGILIEYIDGFRLSDLIQHTDQAEWNYLVNRAVEVTGEILNTGNVLDQDVRPDNMMVCRDPAWERGYRLVMIDFGNCRFRGENETMEEWGLAKHRQDEDGAMGEIMKIKLKEQAGFLADCKHRLSWVKYAEREC
ncbi:hypothetical protein ACHAQA_002067 [Verticillium albo-atrum]